MSVSASAADAGQGHFFTESRELLGVLDDSGRILSLNPQWERVFGRDTTPFLGRHLSELVHPRDQPALLEAMSTLLREDRVEAVSGRVRAATGEWHYLEGSATRRGEAIYLVVRDVTARRTAEKSLAEAHAAYAGILDSISEAVYVQDEAGRFLHVNRAVERMYGYPRERLIGETPLLLAAPGRNDLESLGPVIAGAYAGTPQHFEFWGRRADGTVFPKEVSLTAGTWYGMPVVIAVARDVSERKAAEAALRRHEETLRDITTVLAARGGDYLANVQAITALAGRLLHGAAALYNRLEDGLLHALGQWQTPADFPAADAPDGHLCDSVIRGGRPLALPDLAATPFQESDPKVRRYSLRSYLGCPVSAPDGRAVGSLCVVWGVRHEAGEDEERVLALLAKTLESEEAHRDAAEALRRSEERLGSIFRAAPVGLAVTRDTEIQECNEAFSRITGYERAELTGQSARRLYPDEGAWREAEEHLARQIGREPAGTVETTWRRRDGGLIRVLLSVTPVDPGNREAGLTTAVLDLSERIEAERALRASESFMCAVLDTSPLGISVRSRDGRLLSCNEAWRRIWAIPAEDVREDMERQRVGLRLDARDDYLQNWWPQIRRVYREGGRLSIPEVRTLGHRSGVAEWVSQDFYAINGEDGEVDRIVIITQDISERKQAEEALRQGERRLADAMEMARLGHWEYDPAADLFTFNEQFYKVLRTSTAAMGGATMPLAEYQRRFLHPDETHTVEAEDRLSRETDRADYTHQIEQRVRFADGQEGWISVRTFVRKDAAGRTTRSYGIIQDITERRRAEERLRETTHMLEEAQRLAMIGSYSLDVADGLWQSSAVLDEIFGTAHREFRRDMAGWLGLVHPEDRAAMEDYFLREVLEHRKDFDRQYRIVRPGDGQVRWVHGRGRLRLDEGGRPVQMLGSIQDITERRQAEEALRASEAHYRLFFEHDLTADYISTADGVLLDCNPAFLRLFCFADRDHALSTHVSTLYPEAARRRAVLERLAAQGKLEYQEMELRDLEGQPVHVIMNVLGIFDEAGRLERMQGYLFDITKYKHLQQQLYQAQKMDSIGRLAGGVAHDFNNLLTVINGHVDLMLGQVHEQDPMRDQLVQIGQAGERAARLTRQLLAFSRRQVLQLVPVDLNTVVGDMQRMLLRLIGEDIRLVTRLDKGLPAVLADAGQLEQVVVNLAVNSRDAMPDGGVLTIATQEVHVDAEFCRLHRPMTPGHYSLLEVMDNGQGMDADTLGRVFEPFFTTKEKAKGTGLGLATVYGIVKQCGGFIWAESEPGTGATFRIFLPAVRDKVEGRAAERGSDQHLRGSECVLVAEDSDMVRRLAVRMLVSHGYAVLEATDGQDALRLLQETDRRVDLVLTDVIMPTMGGRELADRLAALPDPPAVVFMSGYTEDSIARHGILAPGVHFIQKPFDLRSLLQQVRGALDSVCGTAAQPPDAAGGDPPSPTAL